MKKKVIVGENDFNTWCINNNRLDLIEEWDEDENQCKPTEIINGNYYWKCSKGHKYLSTTYNRKKGVGCPYCAGRRAIPGENDLATTNPELIAEWDFEKNEVLPSDVMRCSEKKIYWKCKVGHSYIMMPKDRTVQKTGCYYCSGHRVLRGYNDLATTNPELLKEWDYEKNIIKPTEVSRGHNGKIWWICEFGHSYRVAVTYRTNNNVGCPKCNREKRTSFSEQIVFYYINKYFPDAINGDRTAIGNELDIYIPSRNIAIEYDGEAYHGKIKWSEEKVSFDIKKNEMCKERNIKLFRIREKKCAPMDEDSNVKVYVFDSTHYKQLEKILISIINDISDEKIVPNINVERDTINILEQFVFGTKKNNLKEKCPNLADEWNYNKNGRLLPEFFSFGANYKVWWRCPEGHEYEEKINNRYNNRNCPFCSSHQVSKGENDLVSLLPELAREWNYEKNKGLFDKKGRDISTPDKVSPQSNRKVWWICSTCKHEWEAVIASRSKLDENGKVKGCPKCQSKRMHDTKIKNRIKLGKTLADTAPEVLAFWDYEKNVVKPIEVTKGSTRKVWWLCEKGHSFEMSISNRCKENNCPHCTNRIVVSGENDFATKNPDIINEWDYNKNDVDPKTILPSSKYRAWWICKKCKNEWQTAVSTRTKMKTGCPICGRELASKNRGVRVLNIDTGEVFESISEAAKKYNVGSSHIGSCCKGKRKKSAGYHWKYYDQD